MAKQTAKIPGAVLQKSFLDEYGLTPAKTAEDTGQSIRNPANFNRENENFS